jgi:hypothetical protein
VSRHATYYVQFAEPETEDPRWHTIARVSDLDLAKEIARLAESSYMRTTVLRETHYVARAISRSALKAEGGWPHADWELGAGNFRQYGEALRARAERNLRAVPN